MSTGPEGNGLNDIDAVTARVNTFAPLDQVASADLNTIQDQILVVSSAVDVALAQVGPSRSSSAVAGDTPDPQVYGGGEVWVEGETNGVNVVVLDDNIDWRDRFVVVQGMAADATTMVLPGEAGDDSIETDLDDVSMTGTAIHGFFYSEAGFGAGTPTACATKPISTGNTLRVFVRDTDGALVMKMSPWSADNARLIASVRHSPRQDHY